MQLRYGNMILMAIALLPVKLWGQTDSLALQKFPTQVITEYRLDRNLSNLLEDTVVRKNDVYHPLFRNYEVFQDLGNIGTASQSQQFTWNRTNGFAPGFNPWAGYYKTPEQTQWYRTRRPYADFHYAQGQKELLFFKGKYSINITPRWNMGVDYDRITSAGFYPRQYTSGYFTNLFSSYSSKNGKYTLLASSIWNRGVNDESGGIESDSLFETLIGPNKAAPVQLGSCQTRFRNQTLYFKQYFYLGKSWLETNEQGDTFPRFQPSGFISHTLRYEKDRYAFDNLLGDSVPALNITAGIFSDSADFKRLSNRFTYTSWAGSNTTHKMMSELGLSHQWIQTIQQSRYNEYHNVTADLRTERIPAAGNGFGYMLSGSYVLAGFNQHDFLAEAGGLYRSNSFQLHAGLKQQLYTPDYLQLHYHGTTFNWDNSFSKVSLSQLQVSLATRGFRNNITLLFNQYLFNNYVYYGNAVTPLQANGLVVLQTLKLSKTFQMKWLFLEHRLLWQKSGSGVIRLPELSGNIRYYVSGNLFKKAIRIQLGADVWYNTAYYANAWNPAARVFYLQDAVQVGNYPLLGAFINGQVKTAILFARMEHLNMDWVNSGFYTTPHYPIPVRVFRFGLRWRMYN